MSLPDTYTASLPEDFEQIMGGSAKAKSAIELIAEERHRQIDTKGFSAAHDDEHDFGQIAAAAGCYALAGWSNTTSQELWPWEEPNPWKDQDRWNITPAERINELVKAGALIAAEIDRLQRSMLNPSKV
jgi:hypothetical protein